MSHRVTMADVAREAGVSMMTVSRVVNHKGGISEATRQRVQMIIDQLGYRPSEIARGLVTRRTGTLGLVVPDNANPFFSEVARGVEHLAYAESYNVILCNTEEKIERELDVLQLLEEKRVDGLVLCSSRLDVEDLQSALAYYSAAVLINRRLDDRRIGQVLIDDEQGGRIATEHLLRRGYRRIGFLGGPETSYSSHLRKQGYIAALHAAGCAEDPHLIWHGFPSVEGGRAVAAQMLGDCPDMTALVCFNDLVAVGALLACRDLNRAVPDDLAVVGFDDIPLAALISPPLTTLHVPRYDMGKQATQLLLDRIKGCVQDCEDIVITPQLVIRTSAP